MGVDPVWVILEPKYWLDVSPNEPQSRNWEHRLLGAVTPDFYNASDRKPNSTKRFLPDEKAEDGIITREINDFVLNTAGEDDSAVDAKLTSYLGAKVVRASTTKVDLSTKAVTFRRLDQPNDYWEKLRDDSSLQNVLPGWLKRAGKDKWPEVCLITGIGICQGAEFEWDTKRIEDRIKRLELPLDAIITVAAGSPLPIPAGLDAGVELAKEKTNVVAFRGKSSKKSVFALELRAIQTKGFIRKEVILARGPEVEDGHRLGGEEDEDSEVDSDFDIENLELRTLPINDIQ